MRMRHGKAVRLAALAAAGALVAGGCSGDDDTRLDMTLKRVNLDLAFKDPEKAKKPITIQQVVDAAPELPVSVGVVQRQAPKDPAFAALPPLPPIKVAPPFTCKPAGSGAVPKLPATTSPGGVPAAGLYKNHQTGTFALSAAILNLRGPVAPESQIVIQNVTDTTTVDGLGTSTRKRTYEQVVPGLSGSTTTTFTITKDELQLTSIKSGKDTFTPTPAITIMQFKDVPGTTWNSAGVDLNSKDVMVVQGELVGREVVDLCGEPVETYKISSQERRVNGQTGYAYNTDSNDPKIYNIATQYGALIVRTHENSTTQFQANGVPGTFTLNATATLNGLVPVPIAPAKK